MNDEHDSDECKYICYAYYEIIVLITRVVVEYLSTVQNR